MSSKENRDTVFCQMRRAMDLIHYVVKDGVLDSGPGPSELRMNGHSIGDSPSGQVKRNTLYSNGGEEVFKSDNSDGFSFMRNGSSLKG